MAKINENYLKLSKNYLFADIARKVSEYRASNPRARVISLGIGDVTQPLAPAVVDAMHKAVDDLAYSESFQGYGPEQGYLWLREKIATFDYRQRGVQIDASEIFVSDGAKSDTGNITELFGTDCSVALTDPVYPVYIDSNVMCGRAGDAIGQGAWSRIEYLSCTEQNDFVPEIPTRPIDLIYLCYPNNPTGMALTKAQLQKWVEYALSHDAIILYDSAYEAYIQDDITPHSIYEIEGAKRCAIEFRSYSKTAGFTGVRCGYTVVPHELTYLAPRAGIRASINALWDRRQCTKFNGASYVSQRAAEAIYSPAGQEQTRQTISYYMGNARLLREALSSFGLKVYGGQNAPYLWVKTPQDLSSWGFFERMLSEVQLVCTPGVGFGPSGEGFVRLTAFGRRQDCLEAVSRLQTWLSHF